jgi:type IV pilus assembly protein PilA
MGKWFKLLSGKGQDRGFTLIELLIVILIVGILAAIAAPLYLGYIRDARIAEGKAVAGALWTSVQAQAVANCNNSTAVSLAYPRAGMTGSGLTNDGRWQSTAGNDITIDCTTGGITPDGTVFTLEGTAANTDIAGMKVQLGYTAANHPPTQLLCAVDGTTFGPC